MAATTAAAALAAPAGSLPWSPPAALGIVVGVFLAAQLSVGFIVAIISSAVCGTQTACQQNSVLNQFIYVLFAEIATVGLLYIILRTRRIGLRQLGLGRFSALYPAYAFMAYPVYYFANAGLTLLAVALFHLNLDQKQELGFDTVTGATDLALTFISLVVLPPIAEEILMRGFLFNSLRGKMPLIWATVLTSIVFAAAHLEFGNGAPLLWVAAIDTFVLSLFLCFLRYKTGSLWPCIFLHGLKNCLAFVVLYVLPHFHSAWAI